MPLFYRGGVLSALRKRVTDTFVRANRVDLGRGIDGSLWQTIRSGLRVDNNRVAAANADFPISTVDMPSTDVNISLTGVTQGSGAALWVQSSEDWTAVTIEQESRLAPATTQTLTGTFQTTASNSSFTFVRVDLVPYTVFTGGTVFYTSGTKEVTSNATGFRNTNGFYFQTGFANFRYTISGTSNFSYAVFFPLARIVTGSFNWTRTVTGTFFVSDRIPYTYTVSFTYQVTRTVNWTRESFNPTVAVTEFFPQETTVFVPGFSFTVFAPFTYVVQVPERTVFDQKVSIRQSIAGNIQLLNSWVVSSAEVIRSLLIRTQGTQVTVKPYSDNNLVSQVGDDLVYDATGASINTRFGLTLAPSPINQGTTVATSASIAI